MSQLEVHQFPYEFYDNYGVLIHSPVTGETACIDAGVSETYLEALDEKEWTLTHILVTHHHRDHITGLEALKASTGAQVIGPDYVCNVPIPAIDTRVRDGDTFTFAGHDVSVIHTPGHTQDIVNYHFEDQKMVFVGDTLFAMGCGKVFFGSAEMVYQSLQKFVSLIPEDTLIYCSHEYAQENGQYAMQVDPNNEALIARLKEVDVLREKDIPTVPFTLATELATNPFLRPHDVGIRRQLQMESATDEEVFVEIRRLRDID